MAISKTRRQIEYTRVKELTDSGNYTVTNDAVVSVKKDTANQGATFITLPTLSTLVAKQGRTIIVKDDKGDAGANNITIVGTVDGAANYTISENYGAVALKANGAGGWGVVFQGLSVSAAELAYLNGVTAGTVTASKALVVDANKAIGNLANTTFAGGNGIIFQSGGGTIEDVASIAAAGTVQGNATALANTVSRVTNADDVVGVVLPVITVATVGMKREIYSNVAACGLKVYPGLNQTINDGSANASVTMEGKSMATLRAVTATNWAAQFTANA